ncbi:NUDIX domain-containing protein [Microbacterium sp. NPDC055903]
MDEDAIAVGGTAVLLRQGRAGLETLLIRRPDRGSFAGGWVFPGGVVEPQDAADAEEDAARAAAIRETYEEVGLVLTDPVTLSRWAPPVEAPKRVRTWFFLAADPGGEIHPAAGEVAGWAWMRPEDALAQHADGAMLLFPPTWVTLQALVGAGSVADVLAVTRAIALFSTRMLDGGVFAWAGDAEHPDGEDGVHRLETSALPWRYRRE